MDTPEYRSPAEREERMRESFAIMTRARQLAKREHSELAMAQGFDELVRANDGELPSANDLAIYLDHFGDL